MASSSGTVATRSASTISIYASWCAGRRKWTVSLWALSIFSHGSLRRLPWWEAPTSRLFQALTHWTRLIDPADGFRGSEARIGRGHPDESDQGPHDQEGGTRGAGR